MSECVLSLLFMKGYWYLGLVYLIFRVCGSFVVSRGKLGLRVRAQG